MNRLQRVIGHLQTAQQEKQVNPCPTAVAAAGPYFLGLDSSTQSLKVVVITFDGSVVYEEGVNFFRDFPQYKTTAGVYKDGLEASAPTLMFVEAMDTVLTRMAASKKFDVSKIVAVSASGQQHGSVYWAKGSAEKLAGLRVGATLKEQLKDAFSKPNGPIWMDSSTAAYCTRMEELAGGAQNVADISGSRAYERFTASQISKIFDKEKTLYDATERISIVSSFIPSVLLGSYAPIDGSDACGMNMIDIKGLDWSDTLLQAIVSPPGCTSGPAQVAADAKTLRHKLGAPTWSHANVGTISPYFQKTFGFSSNCAVVCGSGDNPCTVAGLRMTQEGDVGVSMGTSDTVFAIIPTDKIAPSGEEGHMLRNPVDPNTCMAMLCYKNGSVTRERVKAASGIKSWPEFNKVLASTPAGNNGNSGYYYLEPEIIPRFNKSATFRFGPDGKPVSKFDQATEVRAVIEGQFMSMRVHAAKLGMKNPRRVIATGGASVNTALLEVMASVFNCEVYTASAGPNTAALGAGYRAIQSYLTNNNHANVVPVSSFLGGEALTLAASPIASEAKVYESKLARFQELETLALSSAN